MLRCPQWFRIGVLALAVLPVLGSAQDLTIRELLTGEKLAPAITPAELPEGFQALKLVHTGGTGDMGLGMMMPLMMFGMAMGGMGGGGDQTGMALFSMMGTSWTRGDTVRMAGAEFLVTYQLDINLFDLGVSRTTTITGGSEGAEEPPAAAPQTPELKLKLTLVRTDAITAITPLPDLTKEKLLEMMRMLRSGPGAGSDAPMATPDAPPGGQAMTGGMAPVASRDYATAKEAAQRTQSLSHLKQIALGLVLYASDYDDVFPYAQSTTAVKWVTYPYIKNESIWTNPNPDGAEYRFNIAIGGVHLPAIESPSQTVLVYESRPWPDGRRGVAFTDGSARLVAADQWQELEKTLMLKLPRKGKPLPADYGVKEWAQRQRD